eukprot:Platyproteum_vivax@DN5309_c0_g1_i1.p1
MDSQPRIMLQRPAPLDRFESGSNILLGTPTNQPRYQSQMADCPMCKTLIEENKLLRASLSDLMIDLAQTERINKKVILEHSKALMDLAEVQNSKNRLSKEVKKLDEWLYETKLVEQKLRLEPLPSNVKAAAHTSIFRSDNNPPGSAQPLPDTTFISEVDYTKVSSTPKVTTPMPTLSETERQQRRRAYEELLDEEYTQNTKAIIRPQERMFTGGGVWGEAPAVVNTLSGTTPLSRIHYR